MSYCVALKKRAMLLAIILGMYSIGSAIGPFVGGAITDNKMLTWRFIFWVNLPFGAVGLVVVWFILRNPPPAAKAGLSWIQKIRQLDIPGATVLLGAITCLNLALQWGGIVYPWSNANVFGCLIGFGLLLIAFLYLQTRGKESSTIPLHIFRNRTSVKNTSARDSGIYSLPIIVSNSLGTLSAGWIASRSRHYVPLMWIGAPFLAAGGGLYQLIRPGSPAAQWIGFQILSGAGYGICGQMPILAVQVVLGEADVPTGLVMVLLFQCLGGALAPSIGQNLFTDKLLRNLGEVQGIDGAAVVAAGGREFREIVPPELMDEVIDAFSSALRNVFWLALATPVLAWTVSWAMELRRLPQDREKADTANVATQALTTQNLEK
ncbi:hypothetical protein DL764_000425 [Monosporascus ibericus]|uniref:Major facilitator superfamily (MFS) profile domain-containing protein n=1 Tax=Monosporascus ibericus TaxID=155417 RepID=A0A4Q4TYS2_9PEZI|nr:hypothetical protein DL764_000425 [Monosporascus ibericus]